jgi:hypothetical protein
VCTDGGMYAGARAYLLIAGDGSSFTSLEKERDGTWTTRSFLDEVCPTEAGLSSEL